MGDVIIVEDDLILATLFKRRMERLGYNVVAGRITTGEKAVEAIVSMRPDVVLMDIKILGELDGIEVVHEARKQVDFPVIYMSGNTEPAVKRRAAETNYVAYLSKPFSMEDLEEALGKSFAGKENKNTTPVRASRPC